MTINFVEDQNTEFKESFNDKTKETIYKCIRAFNNTNGGRLFIGIKDDLTIIGIELSNIDQIKRTILEKSNYFGAKIKFEINTYENKKVLIINVERGEKLIFESNNTLAIRNENQVKILKSNDIIEFIKQKNFFEKEIQKIISNNFQFDGIFNWNVDINSRGKFKEDFINLVNNLKCKKYKTKNISIDSNYYVYVVNQENFVSLGNNQITFFYNVFIKVFMYSEIIKNEIYWSNNIVHYYLSTLKISLNEKLNLDEIEFLFDENVLKMHTKNLMKILDLNEKTILENHKICFKIFEKSKDELNEKIKEIINSKKWWNEWNFLRK